MSVTMIGLDAAKSVFQIHAVGEAGKVCGAAHHWGRVLSLGHDVKLVAPEAVKPFVKKGKKNDAADAAAVCVAASRPDVKFVPQEPGAAGNAGIAFGAIPVGQAADDAGQRHARPGHRIWTDRCEGPR